MTASGDIELNRRMRMSFRPSTVTISAGDKVWSNADPG